MRVLLLCLVVLAVGAAAYALWPRTSSPEEQVRAAVREMEQGLAARDAAKVLDHISSSFQSPTLGSRADVQRAILGEVLRGGGVRVVTVQSEVLAEPEGRWRWRGRVAAARAGGAGVAAITEAELRQFHVEAVFGEERGRWQLLEASVTPLE